jgi:hypothetical protein
LVFYAEHGSVFEDEDEEEERRWDALDAEYHAECEAQDRQYRVDYEYRGMEFEERDWKWTDYTHHRYELYCELL